MAKNKAEPQATNWATASLGTAIASRHMGMANGIIGHITSHPRPPSIGWRDRGDLATRMSFLNDWAFSVAERTTTAYENVSLYRKREDIAYEPAKMVLIGQAEGSTDETEANVDDSAFYKSLSHQFAEMRKVLAEREATGQTPRKAATSSTAKQPSNIQQQVPKRVFRRVEEVFSRPPSMTGRSTPASVDKDTFPVSSEFPRSTTEDKPEELISGTPATTEPSTPTISGENALPASPEVRRAAPTDKIVEEPRERSDFQASKPQSVVNRPKQKQIPLVERRFPLDSTQRAKQIHEGVSVPKPDTHAQRRVEETFNKGSYFENKPLPATIPVPDSASQLSPEESVKLRETRDKVSTQETPLSESIDYRETPSRRQEPAPFDKPPKVTEQKQEVQPPKLAPAIRRAGPLGILSRILSRKKTDSIENKLKSIQKSPDVISHGEPRPGHDSKVPDHVQDKTGQESIDSIPTKYHPAKIETISEKGSAMNVHPIQRIMGEFEESPEPISPDGPTLPAKPGIFQEEPKPASPTQEQVTQRKQIAESPFPLFKERQKTDAKKYPSEIELSPDADITEPDKHKPLIQRTSEKPTRTDISSLHTDASFSPTINQDYPPEKAAPAPEAQESLPTSGSSHILQKQAEVLGKGKQDYHDFEKRESQASQEKQRTYQHAVIDSTICRSISTNEGGLPQIEGVQTVPSTAVQRAAEDTQQEPGRQAVDTEALAREVYTIIRRRLSIERERMTYR